MAKTYKRFMTAGVVLAVAATGWFANQVFLGWTAERRSVESHELYMKYLQLQCDKIEAE